jgi:hypothetical protein
MTVCPNGHDSVSDDFCDVCGMRLAGAPVTPATSAAGLPATAGKHRSDQAVSGGEPCPRCGTLRSGQFCEACGFNFGNPRFTPASPSFTPSPSPSFTPAGPSYTPAGPSYTPAGPSYTPAGPSYTPAGPSYTPDGLSYTPASPDVTPDPPAPSAPQAAPPGPSSSFPYPQTTWTAVVGADRDYYEQVQAVSGPEGAAVAFPSYCAERRFALLGNQMRIGRRSVSRGLAPEIDLTGPPSDPGISRLHAVLVAASDGSWAVLDPGSANGTLVNGTEIPVGNQVALHDGDRINLGAWTAITVHRDGP